MQKKVEVVIENVEITYFFVRYLYAGRLFTNYFSFDEKKIEILQICNK